MSHESPARLAPNLYVMSLGEIDHALVRCPACGHMARIQPTPQGLRLTCAACGHVATDTERHVLRLSDYHKGRSAFGASLWLVTECCGGHQLWAINEAHLDYLATYVGENQAESGLCLTARR